MNALLIIIAIILLLALYIGAKFALAAIIIYADNLKRKGLSK